MPTVEQYQGTLVGCAVGDALGAPVESQDPESVRAYIEAHVRPQDFAGVTRQSLSNPGVQHGFGQYTDDAQLTRELALSCIHKDGFDPKDYGDRIATIFKERRVVGFGSSTIQAAKQLIQGVPWDKSGTGPPSAGNGSAMRASPIGLLHWNDPKSLIRDTVNQGIITHNNPICSAGALIVSGGVALCLEHGKNPNWEKWYGYLTGYVSVVNSEMANTMAEMWGYRDHPMEEVAGWLSSMQTDDWHGISPWVKTSTLWSLYAFLHSPDDFWETMCTAMWPGGDIDTTAAMAGAISGAYNGIDAIPINVAERINDKGRWGYQAFCGLGSKLFQQVTANENRIFQPKRSYND